MEWTSIASYPVQDMYLELSQQMRLEKQQDREALQGALVMCKQYEHEVTAKDIKGKKLIPKDKKGRTVRVIASEWMPFRVWASDLDYDILVFCRMNRSGMMKFFGWSEPAAVDEAPIWWWMRNGERAGFAHEVETNVMWPMPQTFDFIKDCQHGVGIWKDWPGWWECFRCGRHYDDASTREWMKTYVPRPKPRTAPEGSPEGDEGAQEDVGKAGE